MLVLVGATVLVAPFSVVVAVLLAGVLVVLALVGLLLMLVAPRGSTIRVTTSGPEAEPLMQALAELVDNYFGEGR